MHRDCRRPSQRRRPPRPAFVAVNERQASRVNGRGANHFTAGFFLALLARGRLFSLADPNQVSGGGLLCLLNDFNGDASISEALV